MSVTWDKINIWVQTAGRLKNTKKSEGTLRREICEEMFDGKTGKFTEKQLMNFSQEERGDDIQETLHLELTAKSTTTLKADEGELQILKNEGLLSEAAEACFERKLAIKDGPLRKIPKDDPVWKAITETPGMPTLEVRKIEDGS
jgi:hypothetical protein